jgi:cbb3-type cytochrome oxidase maturation protein
VEALYALIPLSLALMGLAVWALIWAIERGQFDEIEDQGRSVLDEVPRSSAEEQGMGGGQS